MKCPAFLNDVMTTVKKNSPALCLIGAGIAAGATVFLACKSTLRIHEAIEQKNEDLKQIQMGLDDPDMKYSVEDARSDKLKTYGLFALRLGKLYLPAALAAGTSVALAYESYHISKGRNVALATALGSTYESFKAYRDRVKERYGEEAENAIYHNLHSEKIIKIETDENGKERKVKETANNVLSHDSNYWCTYRFDANTSSYFDNNDDFNLTLISQVEHDVNDRIMMLRARNKKNIICLNDVFEQLGMAKTKEGQIIGWCYDPEKDDPETYHISFGAQMVKEPCDVYTNGFKDTIVLDFNCDGVLLDLM